MPPIRLGRGKQRSRGQPNQSYPRDRTVVSLPEEAPSAYSYLPGNFANLYQPQSRGSNMSAFLQSQKSASMDTEEEEEYLVTAGAASSTQQGSEEVSDIEKLRRLKETILAGQHPYFRAIPQPEALASIFLGPNPASLSSPSKDFSIQYDGANVGEATVSPVQSHARIVRAAPAYVPEELAASGGNSRVANTALRPQSPNVAPTLDLPRVPGPTPQSVPPSAFGISLHQQQTGSNGLVSDSHPNGSIPPMANDFRTTTPSPLPSGGPQSSTSLLPPQRRESVQIQSSSALGSGPSAEQSRVLPPSGTVPQTAQDDNASANKIQPAINDTKDSASFREAHNIVSPGGYDRERERERERPTYQPHESSARFESPRYPPPDRRDPGRYGHGHGPRHPDTRYDRDRDWGRGRDWEADKERERDRDRDRERERLRDRLEYGRPPPPGDRRPLFPPSSANVELKSVASLEPRAGLGTRPPPPELRRPDIAPSLEHRRMDAPSLYPEQRRPDGPPHFEQRRPDGPPYLEQRRPDGPPPHPDQRRPEISPRVEHRPPEVPPHPEQQRRSSEVPPHPDQRTPELSYPERRSEMPPQHGQRRTEQIPHSEQQRRSDVPLLHEQRRPDIPQLEQRRPDIPPPHDQRRPEVTHQADSRRIDTDVHRSEPPASQPDTRHPENTPQLEQRSHDVSHPHRHPEPASRPTPSPSAAEQPRPEPASTPTSYPQQSPHDRDRFRVPQGGPRSGNSPSASVSASPHREKRPMSVSSTGAIDDRSTGRPPQSDQHQRPPSATPMLRPGPPTSEDHLDNVIKPADRGTVRPGVPPGDNNARDAPRSGPPDRRGPPPSLDHVPRTPVSVENRPGPGHSHGPVHDEREPPRPYYSGTAPHPPPRSAGLPHPTSVSPRRPVDPSYEGPRDRRPSSTSAPYRDGPPRNYPEDSRRQSLDNNDPRRASEGFYPPHPPPVPGSNSVDRRDEIRQWREREAYPPPYAGPDVAPRDRSRDRSRFPDNAAREWHDNDIMYGRKRNFHRADIDIHPPRGRPQPPPPPPPPPPPAAHASWDRNRPVEIVEKDKDREGYEPWTDRKFTPRGSPPLPPPPARWEEPPHVHRPLHNRPQVTYDERFIPRDIAERGRYPPPAPGPGPDVPMRDGYRDNPRVRQRSPSPTGRPPGVYDDGHRPPKRARDEYDAPAPHPPRPPYYDEARRGPPPPPTDFNPNGRAGSPTYYDPRPPGMGNTRDPVPYGRDRAPPDQFMRRDMPPPRSPAFYSRERYPPR